MTKNSTNSNFAKFCKIWKKNCLVFTFFGLVWTVFRTVEAILAAVETKLAGFSTVSRLKQKTSVLKHCHYLLFLMADWFNCLKKNISGIQWNEVVISDLILRKGSALGAVYISAVSPVSYVVLSDCHNMIALWLPRDKKHEVAIVGTNRVNESASGTRYMRTSTSFNIYKDSSHSPYPDLLFFALPCVTQYGQRPKQLCLLSQRNFLPNFLIHLVHHLEQPLWRASKKDCISWSFNFSAVLFGSLLNKTYPWKLPCGNNRFILS